MHTILAEMTTPPVEARKLLVDEFGVLSAERVRRAPYVAREEFLAAEFRSWVVDLAADETTILTGNIYTVQVGQKAVVKSWISLAAVSKAVGGARAFQKLVTVTFKALAGVIGNTAAEALQTEARTGYRKLVASPIPDVIELPKAA